MIEPARCRDSRPCFARRTGICMILKEAYEKDGECPFCKEKITDNEARKRRKHGHIKKIETGTECA